MVEESISAVSSSLLGNVAISCVAAFVAGLSAWAFGLPFPLVLALITGFLDLIPQVGATVAAVILVAVALTVSTEAAVAMAVIQLIYQQLENYVVYPIVYRRAVELSGFTTIVAVLIGGYVARRRRRDPRGSVRGRDQDRAARGRRAAPGANAGHAGSSRARTRGGLAPCASRHTSASIASTPARSSRGGLVGAFERMQLGSDTKLLDAVFVANDPESGGLGSCRSGQRRGHVRVDARLPSRRDPPASHYPPHARRASPRRPTVVDRGDRRHSGSRLRDRRSSRSSSTPARRPSSTRRSPAARGRLISGEPVDVLAL